MIITLPPLGRRNRREPSRCLGVVAGKSVERFTKFASCPPQPLFCTCHMQTTLVFCGAVLMNIMRG